MYAAVFAMTCDRRFSPDESIGAVVIARTERGLFRRVKAVVRKDLEQDLADPAMGIDADTARKCRAGLRQCRTIEEVSAWLYDYEEATVTQTTCLTTYAEIRKPINEKE